jgi:hypothetical protein
MGAAAALYSVSCTARRSDWRDTSYSKAGMRNAGYGRWRILRQLLEIAIERRRTVKSLFSNSCRWKLNRPHELDTMRCWRRPRPCFSFSRLTFSPNHAPHFVIPLGVAPAVSMSPASRLRSSSVSLNFGRSSDANWAERFGVVMVKHGLKKLDCVLCSGHMVLEIKLSEPCSSETSVWQTTWWIFGCIQGRWRS